MDFSKPNPNRMNHEINPIIRPFKPTEDTDDLRIIAERAFGGSSDAQLDEWFSSSEMEKMIQADRGVALVAKNGNDLLGWIYAQQESPINGNEGREKWVIIMTAVDPDTSGSGIGSKLLTEIEQLAHGKGARKMFVFTNEDDKQVINFYHKNGYENAGRIRDYQYGENNSAVFLLKYLVD